MQKKADEEAMLKNSKTPVCKKTLWPSLMVLWQRMETMSAWRIIPPIPVKYADSKESISFTPAGVRFAKAIDQEVTADMSKLPVGVTLIKTDFDSATDLRKQYGVTTQYTFGKSMATGRKLKWSATSLSDAVAGMKL